MEIQQQKLLNDINYINAGITYSGQVQKPTSKFTRDGRKLSQSSTAEVLPALRRQLLVSGNLFFAGICETHSFVINAAYQSRDTGKQYAFTNNFPLSRGYDALNFPRMLKVGINYHFPLFYPDGALRKWYIFNVYGRMFL